MTQDRNIPKATVSQTLRDLPTPQRNMVLAVFQQAERGKFSVEEAYHQIVMAASIALAEVVPC
jgi:Fe2+ or Zn2+ uptake regulation protein